MNTTAAPIDRRLLEGSLADFRHSYTLPGEAYTSPELFAWEMRNFFEPTWVCLGRTEGLMRPRQPAGASRGRGVDPVDA